jgi:hypothetical protein
MKLLLGTLLLLCCSLNSWAQEPNWKKNPEFTKTHPCIDDLAMFCRNAPMPEKKNRYRCLGEKFNELSPSCYQFMVDFWKPFPCSKEIIELCPGKKGNTGNSFNCIKQFFNKVSPSCQEYIKTVDVYAEEKNSIGKLCSVDLKKLCPTIAKIDEGKCLQPGYKAKTLTPGCMKAIDEIRKTAEKFNVPK